MICRECGSALWESSLQSLKALGVPAMAYVCVFGHYSIVLEGQQYSLRRDEWDQYQDMRRSKKYWHEIEFRRRVRALKK